MLAYNIYNGFCKHLFDVGVEVYEVPFDLAAAALQKHLQGVSKAEAAAFLDGCDGGDFAADLLYYLNEQGSGYDWDKPDALVSLQSALDRVCADWLADAVSPRPRSTDFLRTAYLGCRRLIQA
ncbi:hypothetical protein LNQ82_02715 [Conchiformibius steedae DSM 2580]|uniref:Uncharacterized protein n=1 Tax=Conchiformibius steedae DSM 2580 TaxID=1121352 RepID=A0AAE9KYV4_9NEIS|nr:hypothetical protein [Conchiformibius steedae]QMT33441.1 hypothetical protein H3L98_10240 [Conchiformibius steedae]URD68092.1 hypothetical protein LNQ82_02715 [Conchiformibius steedae DSM 2580]